MTETIRFTLDGRDVEAGPDESIWQVARREGIEIPHLCWLPQPGYRADGNCRACMVEVEGERVLAASCIRKPAAGMKVATASERAVTARRMVMELLVADQPARADAAATADALAAASTVEPDPKKREQLIKGALAEYRQQINIIPLHRQIIPWAMRSNITVTHSPGNWFDADRTRVAAQ